MSTYLRTHVISLRWFFPSLLLSLSLLTLTACGQGNGQTSSGNAIPTPTPVLDVYGTPIAFPKAAPQRIVSLAPSISEILAALHLTPRVVGVDADTNYPAEMTHIQRVSDAMGTLNVEGVVGLHPDLILSSGGLTKTYDVQLQKLGLRVVDLPSPSVTQTLQQIELIGRLTFTESAADVLVKQMQQQIDQIRAQVKGDAAPSVLLEVDYSTPGKPYVFGGGSFGDGLVQIAHATNIFHSDSSNGGYPQVTDESVIADNPQFVILTDDLQYGGDPANVYKRANWSGIAAVQMKHVYHINSDITQRPGPRLVQGLRCLAQILHPGSFPGPLPAYCS